MFYFDAHNLHMHTRYIIYTDGEPYIRVTHNLHMHTRYIFVGARADATFLVSQPTYAYKIYQHLLLISNGASSSQPTYAYKIYRFHFHITVMGCITHNLHMHTRYIDGNKTTLQQLDLTTYICIQDISYYWAAIASGEGSQPTYAYKIYPHLSPTGSGYKHSQPTYAYKIYHQINTNISCLQGLNL